MNYLITGIGRTGTKWLAACMGWPHEPKNPMPAMVSPAHLHRLAFNHWTIEPERKVAIVVRDAHDQMRSILSRMRALHIPWDEVTIDKRHQIYRETIELLIRSGAGVMRYEVMTRTQGHLDRELEQAGMPPSLQFFPEPLNVFPARPEFATLPRWAERIADDNQRAYDRWLRDRGMRSFTEGGSSETTTSSQPRSQP